MLRSTLLAALLLFNTGTANAPDFRAEVVTLTNAERAKAGCAALKRHPALDTAAQGHAA